VAAALVAFATTTAATQEARAQEAPAQEAPAQDAPAQEARAPEAAASAVDHRQSMWRVELGYRGSFLPDSGYDPFSTNSFLPQSSLVASRTIFTWGRLSFAAGLAWDHGASSASARGAPASLEMNRLTAPLEGRVHFGPWGYAFVREAPGVAQQRAQIDESSAPAPLYKNRWLFATDLSAGWALLIAPRRAASSRVFRMWLQGEGGYGWVAGERLALTPDLPSSDPRRTSGVDLGNISTSGAFFRISAAASF
jgi:hypothetical protein